MMFRVNDFPGFVFPEAIVEINAAELNRSLGEADDYFLAFSVDKWIVGFGGESYGSASDIEGFEF